MKTNKRSLILLASLLILALLAGCGGGGATPTPAPTTETDAGGDAGSAAGGTKASSSTLNLTVLNLTSYIFNELFITPTGDNEWGEDHFGSTSILKKNGSFPTTVRKYDFENYDVLVVDEDDYEYQFDRITLRDNCELAITLDDGGLTAIVTYDDGTQTGFAGEMYTDTGDPVDYSGSGDDGGGSGDDGGGSASSNEIDGYSTGGVIAFTIYNESDYDVYSVHIGLPSMSADEDVDVLPTVMAPHSSREISININEAHWSQTEWTMYVTDTAGDTSTSYDRFNPWSLSYVDIYWESGGYVCSFEY